MILDRGYTVPQARTLGPSSAHHGPTLALGRLDSEAATSPSSPTHRGQQPAHKAGPSNQPNQGPATPTRPTTACHSKRIHVIHLGATLEHRALKTRGERAARTPKVPSAQESSPRSGNITRKQNKQS